MRMSASRWMPLTAMQSDVYKRQDYDTGRITTFLCSVQHSPDVEVSDFRHIIESMTVSYTHLV